MENKSILSKTGWWFISKPLSRKVGLEAAILITDLSSKQEYFGDRDELDYEGYFFNLKEDIEEDTTLSPYQQNKALEVLIKTKLIDIKRQGTPPRTFYRVNIEKLNHYIIELYNSEKRRKLEAAKKLSNLKKLEV